MSRIVEKPWGHELIWAETDKYVGKYLYIEPGKRLSRQYHEVKDETILVVSGNLTLQIGEGPPHSPSFLCDKGVRPPDRSIYPRTG